jgi:DUF4097 and DUF4098 domain-containing protein YvlB
MRIKIVKARQIPKILLIFILLYIFVFYPTARAEKYTFPLHKEFPGGTNPSLKIENISGEIKIESHKENQIIIDAFKVVEADDSGEAEKLADQIEIVIEKHEEKLEIKTQYPSSKSRSFWDRVFSSDWKSSGYVDYRIIVPEKINLDVSSVSGEVKISNITGKVKASSTSGDLWIKRITGALNLETTSGDMEISMIEGDVTVSGTSSDLEMFDVKGNLDVNSTSGNVSAESIGGSVRIDNTSGDLFLKRIEGNIRATTVSGSIVVDQAEGGLHLESSSGDLEVTSKILPAYEYYGETLSGHIHFLLPKDSDAEVKLTTTSGDLDCQLPLTLSAASRNSLKGKLGRGGPSLNLMTTSGDIELRGYKR